MRCHDNIKMNSFATYIAFAYGLSSSSNYKSRSEDNGKIPKCISTSKSIIDNNEINYCLTKYKKFGENMIRTDIHFLAFNLKEINQRLILELYNNKYLIVCM